MVEVFIVLLGLSNGIIVGSGIVALITLLDIVPRLAQLTKTYQHITTYELIIVIGATLASFASLSNFSIRIPGVIIVVVGFAVGIFVGLLASALAEVMNVIPIVLRRFRLEGYVHYILYSLIFGKVLGSLFQWIMIP